ncbi:MAG: metallophosphoesterase [Candidatus Thorarchaeota archaeon]
MLVAVSDIHLGDRASNRTGFLDFIEQYLKPNARDISEVYLLGDILDLWRRNSFSVIRDNLEILKSICSLGFQVYYIVGNHDFVMTDVSGDEGINDIHSTLRNGIANLTFSFSHRITNAGKRFRFIHGHQVDYWYSLPFYETFCRAMCHVHESSSTQSNLWELIQSYSKNLSPIVASRIVQLSEGTRNSIEQKLAGSLVGQMASREESAIIELNLLSQFIDISRLCLENFRKEIKRFCEKAILLTPELECIKDLANLESEGTPEELVNQFLIVWGDVHRWGHNQNKIESMLREHKQLLMHVRRIAAMLTVNLQPDEFLIHGHGHQGGINEKLCVADTGCWLRNQGSFITIDEGVVRIFEWP